MKKCAVIGSINMDMVLSVPRFPAAGETLTGGNFQTVPGGKGANQAVALGRLGAPVRMAGRVGDDAFGRRYLDHFRKNGVDVRAVDAVAGTATGVADILVNAAGGNRPAATTGAEFFAPDGDSPSFFDLDESAIRGVFDVNCLSALLAAQVFARDMIGRPGACIVNVSSMNAFRPLTKIPAYSAAKAALSNLTMWLAAHFAASGLRVNAIAPGFFITNQNRDMLFKADRTPTPRTEKILAATPMRRFGEPEELLGALLFLVNPAASSFVTGVVLPIDGGFSAYSGV